MRTAILGIGIDTLPRPEVAGRIRRMLDDGKKHQLVTVNPEFIMEAQHHRAFREVLLRASLAVADGIGIRFAAKALHQPIPPRITGIELLGDLVRIAVERKERVYFLGGAHGVAHRAAGELLRRFPTLAVVGAESGHRHLWRLSDPALRERIDRAHPTILFVAFGAPKQELWIARNLSKLHSVRIAVGVGGAFDFLAGRVRRAPAALRRLGFEWAWRLLVQPWRAQRILTATWRFWRAVQQEKRTLRKKVRLPPPVI